VNWLQMQTVIFSYFITNALITLFIALLWIQNRKRYAGLGFWLIDFILQVIGILLLSLRGTVPDLVSVVIAQTLIAAGVLCLLIGLELFLSNASSQTHNYLSIAGFIGLMAYFTFIHQDINIRTVLISVVTILLTGQCGWLLLHRTKPSLRPITRDVGVILLLYSLLAFVRIISLIEMPSSASSGLFESPALQVLFVFINQILCIGLTFALIMLVTRRLEMDVQNQAALALKNDTLSTRIAEKLSESEKRYRQVVELAPDAIVVVNTGKVIFVNPAAVRLMGAQSADELLGKPVMAFVHPDFRERVFQRIQHAIATEAPLPPMEAKALKLDGSGFDVDIISQPITYDGQPAMNVVMRDITERKRVQTALEESEARYHAVAQTAHDAIISADHAGNIVGWNRGAERLFGYTETEAIGEMLTVLVPPQYSDSHLTGLQRIQAGGDQHVIGKTVELSGLRKDGSEFPLELALSEWQIPEGKFYTGIIRDITDRKQIEEKLKELSIHDSLTGLYNRGFFEEEMTRLGRGRQFPVSIIMADLNDLKETNDRDGHMAGDDLLQRTAQVFLAAFRGDDIIARIGGDEFTVLLPNTDAASAKQSLHRLRQTLEKYNAAHSGTPLSIAFGVCTAEQGVPLTDALKEADARMYAEKRGT
jgi:diguanylate cyclase (GGDEF)-like protein/PAS domain S-box-containing protein